MKPGYKQTEVGVIPEEWESPRIRDAAAKSSNATVGGPFGSDLVSADYVESGVPVIRGQNMSFSFVTGDFVFVSEKKARSLSANLAHPKDLVFTQRGTLGQVAIVPGGSFESYLISQSQMKVSLDRSRYDPLFLHQYFTSAGGQKQIVTSAIQTGVPHTNLGILRAYRFPAPPLPEQRAIATALSDVDALLGGLDRLIAKKRDLKQAAMQQLLTGQTRLPGFHAEWEVAHIGETTTKVGSGITPTGGESVYKSEGRPFLRSQNIGWGTLLLDDVAFIDDAIHYTFADTEIKSGDVFLNITGASIGRSSVADSRVEGGNVNQHVCIIRADLGRLIPRFINYVVLSTTGQRQIDSFQAGGNRQGLNFAQVRSIRLPLPPLPEQTAIAEVLSEMDAELAVLTQRRDKTRALKQAMMQELLTGRIRLVASSGATE